MTIMLIAVSCLAGCRTATPGDLRLEAVSAAKLVHMPGVWPGIQSRKDIDSAAITVLKIDFSSQFDFVRLAKSEVVHLSFDVFSCDSSGRRGALIFALQDLRINDFSAGGGAYSAVADLERYRDVHGRLTYHMLMPVAGKELQRLYGERLSETSAPFYKVQDVSGDLCLQVTGSTMLPGTKVLSNVVRIPKSRIPALSE